MLTSNGISALVKFTDATGATIITRSMSDYALAQMSKKLLAWENDPTAEKEREIVDEFATKPEPVIDY